MDVFLNAPKRIQGYDQFCPPNPQIYFRLSCRGPTMSWSMFTIITCVAIFQSYLFPV
jgi:hypothetical protein